jgi:hypothetical protein
MAPTWETTWAVGPDTLNALDQFIMHPDTRTSDIFLQKNFPIRPGLQLEWLIKHDLFEGVVLHASLMDTEEYRLLGQQDRHLRQASDALGDIVIDWRQQRFVLHVTA